MEIKRFILLLQRWAWLLGMGLLVGLLAGFFASRYQEPTYRAATQLLVSRELQSDVSNFAGLNNQQLALTYVQILKTKRLRDATSERIGGKIGQDQINVKQIPDTQIIEITVENNIPELAAQIANTMVLILIEENETVQSGQFAALESSLNSQITQVEEQITVLQSEYDQVYKQNYQNQLSIVDKQLSALKEELSILQTEIATLTNALTVEQRAQLADLESQAVQLQSNIRIYNDIRANLLVLGKPFQASQGGEESYLLQVRSTIDLYQQMYLNLLSSLESTRLARLQQTPNIVQIEEAFVPENPIRPNPLLNTLLSGIAGFILASAISLLIEVWETEIKNSDPPVVLPKKKSKKKVEKNLKSIPNS